jgi:hypothetical protein
VKKRLLRYWLIFLLSIGLGLWVKKARQYQQEKARERIETPNEKNLENKN